MCLIYIWKKIPLLRIYKEDWKLDLAEIKHHLKIGLPMGFQNSVIAMGTFAVQITLNSLGPAAVAATAAAQKINNFATMPLRSFGITMATFAAQNYGANKINRVWEGVSKVTRIILSYSAVMALILIFFGDNISKIFIGNSSPEIIELVDIYFLTHATFYFLLGLLFVYRYTLQGLGKSGSPTAAGVMELFSRVIAAAALAQIYGFTGVSIAGPLAWAAALFPLMGSYYTLKRSTQGKKRIPVPKISGNLFK